MPRGSVDHQLAIRRSDADLLALGHPFIDAMLAYAGSYDFGGLTTVREIVAPEFGGRTGFLFAFVVRYRVAREDGDECLFEFAPVFVTADGKVDESVVRAAVECAASDSREIAIVPPEADVAFRAARKHLEAKAGLWDWEDDVEFLGMSWVVFK
jgi:hypothetical protein